MLARVVCRTGRMAAARGVAPRRAAPRAGVLLFGASREHTRDATYRMDT